ncbi:MAG: hypothetical protein Fur0040_09950 [Sideroxydans sp.]
MLYGWLVLLACWQAPASALQVTLVLSENNGPYREFADELERELGPAHGVHRVMVGEPYARSNLTLAVGSKASAMLADLSVPVLHVMVTRTAYSALSLPATHSAIYLDQPPARHAALIAALLPEARRVGMLFSRPDERQLWRRTLDRFDLLLQASEVEAGGAVGQALSEVLVASDVLLASPDTTIYRPDTIRNILLDSYRAGVPLIGLSAAYVRAGALCAVYVTPQQMARQTARVIEGYAASGKLPSPQFAREFEIAVNPQVAHSLGITLRDEVQLRIAVGRADD